MPRKYTEAQKRSAAKWDAGNIKRIQVVFHIEQADAVIAAAEKAGESVSAYIRQAALDRIVRDQGKTE